MLIEALLTMLAVAAPHKAPAAIVAPSSAFAATPSPAYQPQARAVDNWRFESALALEMAPVAAIRRAFGAEAGEPARCVKLNNYWCIKSAGWNGEIAADADGHVAFASAEEGAAVAALLLRRYYVDYGRRTARAIVERWAPAQCSLVLMPAAPRRPAAAPGLPASRGGMARMPPQRVAPMAIAPRGIQNTLRARWLAAHGRGGVNLKTARRPLAKPVDLMPAPSIMAGVSELPARREKLAELIQPAPQTTCRRPAAVARAAAAAVWRFELLGGAGADRHLRGQHGPGRRRRRERGSGAVHRRRRADRKSGQGDGQYGGGRDRAGAAARRADPDRRRATAPDAGGAREAGRRCCAGSPGAGAARRACGP